MSTMVLNRTAVARIRKHAAAQQAAASRPGIRNEPIAAYWRAIEAACRELDPAAVPGSRRKAVRPKATQLSLFTEVSA